MQPKLDMEGLIKAFADHERGEREYLLDTETGTVHFVPTEYLRLAERGKLDMEALKGQAREKAEIAQYFLDDISGRYEIVPFVEPEAEGDWRVEFCAERGAQEVTPDLQMAWQVYKQERLQDEVVTWLEDAGILDENDEDETWEEE